MKKFVALMIFMIPLFCLSSENVDQQMDCFNPADDGACDVDRCMRFPDGILINTMSSPRMFFEGKYFPLNRLSKNRIKEHQSGLIVKGDIDEESYSADDISVKVTRTVEHSCTGKDGKTGKYIEFETCCEPSYSVTIEIDKSGKKITKQTSWGIQC